MKYDKQLRLKFPVLNFFKVIKRVRNYKKFVPWCVDSWETNKTTLMISESDLFEKYPILNKENCQKILQKYKNSKIPVKTFDGGMKVGFHFLDFSYTSQVLAIEPNIILSTVDGENSLIFKELQSLWILNKKNNEDLIADYSIKFEFKSKLFYNATSVFLNFMGENIVKAFINRCNKEQELLEEQTSEEEVEGNFNELIVHKFERISFESEQEKLSLKTFLEHLFIKGKLTLKEIELILKKTLYSKEILKKLIFFSELIMWHNNFQVEKIIKEIQSNIRV
jgi:ribosome-associated toxin RatA of RatAB toxin-antitoxin module